MIVYRVEDREGEGFYRSADTPWDELGGGYQSEPRHPAPWRDARLAPEWSGLEDQEVHREWHFGFTSKASLKRWFWLKEDRVTMHRSGLRVAVYEVPKEFVKRGAAQCIFHGDYHRDCHMIEVIDLDKI
jgi:hypothetical protein